MSLDWNLEKIKDNKTVCWIPNPQPENAEAVRMNPVTESLIWATMGAGIGKITEENVDEFAYRVHIWERVFGGMTSLNGKEKEFAYEEIRAHIGLSTNVSNETRAQWKRRLADAVMREFGWQTDRWLEHSKKAVAVS